MAPKSLLVLAALALAACSSGGGDDDATPTTPGRGACPLATAEVEEAVAHPVEVERRSSGPGSCAYTGTGDAAGARVEVVARDLDDDEGYGEVLATVEQRSGPTVELPGGLVDGADRGWVAAVGRAVQVGAVAGDRLVVVSVVDPLLDVEEAEEVAGALAGEALDG